MEAVINAPEDTAPHLEKTSRGPIRILVETKTHLVPGEDWHGKCLYMLDVICQYHWNRQDIPKQDRWSVYGAEFGYTDRPCYFLVDHGQSSKDDDVPLLRYQWTGEALKVVSETLPPRLQRKLRKYPFTRPLFQDIPKRPSLSPATRCQSIRSALRCEMKLPDDDFKFLIEHPEEARWLKDHIELRFWSRLESKLDSLALPQKSQEEASIDPKESTRGEEENANGGLGR